MKYEHTQTAKVPVEQIFAAAVSLSSAPFSTLCHEKYIFLASCN